MQPDFIIKTDLGIFCPKGQFYIDPRGPAPVALITHAHGDHAYLGSEVYYCHEKCFPLLQHRLGKVKLIKKAYGEKFKLGNAWVSFHPAGHIMGSAQIRVELNSHITVVSGDYKRHPDPTCEPFEVLKCDEFITESTFALPIYRWPSTQMVAQEILDWWNNNAEQDHASILFCYALGKAQHIQSLLTQYTDKKILVHGAIASINELYQAEGVPLLPWQRPQDVDSAIFKKSLILAPPSAMGSSWSKKFFPYKTALASGWMTVRGTRRRKGYDTGFVLSDHADWPALIDTIKATQAKKIWTTHGFEETLALYLSKEEKITSVAFHLSDGFNDEMED